MNLKISTIGAILLCLASSSYCAQLQGSRGLSQYNSSAFAKKLPVSKNSLDCNSEDAKQFVNSIFSRDGETPSFIGGFKNLKKSKNTTYCSVSYKIEDDLRKLNYWIQSDNNETNYYDEKTMPIACDSEDVVKMIKSISEKRKISIEEIGGYNQSDYYGNADGYTRCTFAYKTSDIENVANLSYTLSRDEDFNIVLETDENDFKN